MRGRRAERRRTGVVVGELERGRASGQVRAKTRTRSPSLQSHVPPTESWNSRAHAVASGHASLSHPTHGAPQMAAPPAAPDGLITRRLRRADFDAGFLALLAQLSVVGDVDRAAFEGEKEMERVWVWWSGGAWEDGRVAGRGTARRERKSHSNKIGSRPGPHPLSPFSSLRRAGSQPGLPRHRHRRYKRKEKKKLRALVPPHQPFSPGAPRAGTLTLS